MANLRTGKYGGTYYGSYPWESETLSNEEMHVNARYLYEVLHYIHGWSIHAISGMLGNIQHESAMNPGRWQSDTVQNNDAGYGLVQWTPATKYFAWCTEMGYADPSDMDVNIERIIYEVENNVQYYPTDDYTETFAEFTVSTEEPYYLACAFAWNYERSAVVLWGTEEEREALREQRGGSAEYWYTYLSEYYEGIINPPITPTIKKKRKSFNFILFNRRRKAGC